MNGYVEGGYLVTIGVVSSYALTLLRRERVVRRRLEGGRGQQPVVQTESVPQVPSEQR